MTTTNAPRLLVEPASPFVPRRTRALPQVPSPREPPLVVTILKDTVQTATIIQRGSNLDRLVVSSIFAIVVASAVFVSVALANFDLLIALRSAAILPMNLTLALAAALGPIYAASIVYSARIPMSRLVAALLSSTAAGALILAAVAPLPWLGFSVDPKWLGPFGLVAAFFIAAATAGLRLKQTLLVLARRGPDDQSTPLSPEDEARVVIVARVASMTVGLTVAVALWGFDALLPVL